MTKKIYLSWDDIGDLLEPIDVFGNLVYGVPRGGMIATMCLKNAKFTCNPTHANVILDDIVDSGRTMDKYTEKYPDKVFYALINKKIKSHKEMYDGWVVFPWEKDKEDLEEDTDHITRLLELYGLPTDEDSVHSYKKKFKEMLNL